MFEKVDSIIQAVSPVSTGSLDKIKDLVDYIDVKQGESITKIGQTNKLEYFVIDGICKSFLHTPDGEDVTISFFMSQSVVSPSTTRNSEGRSIVNLRALTDLVLATIDADAFEKLMIEDLEIRNFGNTVLRNELMEKVRKEIALASLRGKDRLIGFRKRFQNIENLVPHADIASYLGMTTITLSRLRTQS